MEKKKLTQEMIDSGIDFKDQGFEWCALLPYSECEKCALELASRTIVADVDGVTYYNYNQLLIERFFKFKYFSNIDTDDWDTEDGMRILYDAFRNAESCDIYQAGWDIVSDIVCDLFVAIEEKNKRTASLDYKIGKMLSGILDGEDIIEKVAQSRDVTETMAEMIRVFKENKSDRSAKNIPLTFFAKK